MKALICGSLAYDTIMSYPETFADSILTNEIYHINVCFLVPHMRREFGGTGGNIAYNLKLLGGDPLIMATLGTDGTPYRERLAELQIPTTYVKMLDDAYTAQAFITTDVGNNQITAFHPGAMAYSHRNKIADAVSENVSLAIVAPDGRDAMIEHAKDLAAANIPFIFDPGQGLPMFNREELRTFISQATYVAVNSYESEMLSQTSGLSTAEIASQVKAYIVTRAENGSSVYTDGTEIRVASVPPVRAVDPTGCGDAYRAGLIYGLTTGRDLETSAQLASLMGSLKVEHGGPQNHSPTPEEIFDRFEDIFGKTF